MNKCNFRDYQNIAVDGARSGPMARTIVNTTARGKSDKPALVVYAMVGNDVCGPHPGTGQMTTPEEFEKNVVETMGWLELNLVAGSHVVFVGLVHGEMIWDVMSGVTYPYFGVTYADVWALLSESWTGGSDNRTLNPCWGWLNPDPKWRNATTQRAMELNAVFDKVIAKYSFKNFDMHYIQNPDEGIVKGWIKQGNPGYQMYEAVGGGHPSTTQEVLWAEAVWNNLLKEFPQAVGVVNSNNAEITKVFGNQGGY